MWIERTNSAGDQPVRSFEPHVIVDPEIYRHLILDAVGPNRNVVILIVSKMFGVAMAEARRIAGTPSVVLVVTDWMTHTIWKDRLESAGATVHYEIDFRYHDIGRSFMSKKTIKDLPDLKGKRVLIRVDFNLPLDKKTGAISNDRRVRGALPTIRHLLDAGASIIAMSHLGRPSGDPAKDAMLKMDKVATRFGELLGKPVKKASDSVIGAEVAAAVQGLKPGDVLMLENLRFDPREQKNDPEFAKAIASLGDVYVNDAFGTCQNDKDASMVAVPAAMAPKPRVLGFLVEKELTVIDGLMANPKRPLLGIMGGAKVSDKIAFINALLQKVDHLLIGGKMTYTFLKARGVDVGGTKVPDEEVAAARNLLPHVGTKITLPVDSLVAKSDDLNQTQVAEGPIPAGYEGVDIGPKTLALYAQKIKAAATIIWNGPVGWFEQPAFSKGTQGVAEAMANSGAITVVGGGETAEAVEKFGFDSKMTHVSTGGGAFLAYVEGKKFQSLAQIDEK